MLSAGSSVSARGGPDTSISRVKADISPSISLPGTLEVVSMPAANTDSLASRGAGRSRRSSPASRPRSIIDQEPGHAKSPSRPLTRKRTSAALRANLLRRGSTAQMPRSQRMLCENRYRLSDASCRDTRSLWSYLTDIGISSVAGPHSHGAVILTQLRCTIELRSKINPAGSRGQHLPESPPDRARQLALGGIPSMAALGKGRLR